MGVPGRDLILADPTRRGSVLCRALSEATDDWLREVFGVAADGLDRRAALVAVGGYGRGELTPGSDLDLMLLHEGRDEPTALAQRLWYPVWDAGLPLGHAVRTPKQALRLASEDLDTATSLLDLRHLAGDEALSESVRRDALAQWRRKARSWLAELAAAVDARHGAAGEVAFLLEPDLKDGRGGLRDVHALAWASSAQAVLAEGDAEALAGASEVLLTARVELHRATGRRSDVLRLQEQDAVADRVGAPDADALMAAVASAARTVAWTSDEAWRRIRSALQGPSGRLARRDRPLAPGIVLRDGEVHLDVSARPADDPVLMLWVATVAARRQVPIERSSLDRLADETPSWPDPWPAGAVDALVALLLEGERAIAPLESLDQRGLLVRALPEWAAVRSKPQRNAYHRFTVDRHLWEAAANAAVLADRVHRPDLLVLGALLHDLGKGWPGDHTDNGVDLARTLGTRMGLLDDDVQVLVALVRHHLLLPDVAVRGDLSDDGTIAMAASAVGSPLVLELLAALTEADSLATGPSAWGTWKAELVAELVDRVGHVLYGGALDEATWSLFPSAEVLELMAEGRTVALGRDERLTTVAPDRPGLFSSVAGVLSLHGLAVLGAQAYSDDQGMAANEFRVAAPRHAEVAWEKVTADLRRALDHQLALEARLAERARTYRRRKPSAAVEPSVRLENDLSSDATVIEVRALDAVGLLYRVTKAMAELGLDIRHARVQTLGHEVVDTFYVRAGEGKVRDEFHRREIERSLLHAVGATSGADRSAG